MTHHLDVTRFVRVTPLFVGALAILLSPSLSFGQSPVPVADASAGFTDGPKPGDIAGSVKMDTDWKNCTGAAKVVITVTEKATGTEKGKDETPTTATDGSQKNKKIFTDLPSGTAVKVKIQVLAADGTVIAEKEKETTVK